MIPVDVFGMIFIFYLDIISPFTDKTARKHGHLYLLF